MPVPAAVDIHPDGAGEIADEGFDSFIGETHYEPYQTWQIPPEYS